MISKSFFNLANDTLWRTVNRTNQHFIYDNVYDYGKELEKADDLRDERIRISPHNTGADYSLTFPSDITCNSKKSIRFEYRYEDTMAEGKTSMQRARSEISGVYSRTLMGVWTIEFDLYVPEETVDDNSCFEIITQIHEHSKTAKPPSFCLSVKGGNLYCSVRGDSIPISDWSKKNKAIHHNSEKLLYLKKDRWYHVKAFVKEGYQYDMSPLTQVWVDSELLFYSQVPNCYNYKPVKKDKYNYIKFGIYKPGWKKVKEPPSLSRRIYYFDNYVVQI